MILTVLSCIGRCDRYQQTWRKTVVQQDPTIFKSSSEKIWEHFSYKYYTCIKTLNLQSQCFRLHCSNKQSIFIYYVIHLLVVHLMTLSGLQTALNLMVGWLEMMQKEAVVACLMYSAGGIWVYGLWKTVKILRQTSWSLGHKLNWDSLE